MHPGELADQHRRPDPGDDVGEQRVVVLVGGGAGGAGDYPAGQWAGLHRDVSLSRQVVARRFRPAVLALFTPSLRVERPGLAVERVAGLRPLVEGVGDVLADPPLVEGEELAVGTDPRAGDQGGVAPLDGRLRVEIGVEVGAGGQVVADPAAVGVQADVTAVADEEAAVAVVLGVVLLDPGEHVVPGAVGQPALDRAAEPVLLQPVVLPVFQDGDRPGDVGEGGGAHDTPGHHEAGMRPLPAEDRVHLGRLAGQDDPRGVAGAGVRGEPPDGLVVERRARVLPVRQVDREQRVEVARDALQRLARLRDVADQRGVGRYPGAPRHVQGIRGLVQVAATADAADAWGHDQAGPGVLAPKDDLEAPEHRRLGPGGGHHAVADRHSDVQIALDPAHRADVEIDGGHRCPSSIRRACVRRRPAGVRPLRLAWFGPAVGVPAGMAPACDGKPGRATGAGNGAGGAGQVVRRRTCPSSTSPGRRSSRSRTGPGR